MMFSEYVDLAETEGKLLLWVQTSGCTFTARIERDFSSLRADYDKLIAPFVRDLPQRPMRPIDVQGRADVLRDLDVSVVEAGVREELWRKDPSSEARIILAAIHLAERQMASYRIDIDGVLGVRMDIDADESRGEYECTGEFIMRSGRMFAVPSCEGVRVFENGARRVVSWRLH